MTQTERILNRIALIVGVVAACVALTANATGARIVCTGNNTPARFSGPITLRYDAGGLGLRSHAAAATIVDNAVALWNNVGTASVQLVRGADLPADVGGANLGTYLLPSDGSNAIIFDSDGAITNLYFGAGNNVRTFSGVVGVTTMNPGPQACQLTQGYVVINGTISLTDAELTNAVAHELGRLIGLDQTQLGTYLLWTQDYPVMYPQVAFRAGGGLHADDMASVTALYPAPLAMSTYGVLSGVFVTPYGVPIRGANIWVQNVITGDLFSAVSGYLMEYNGNFRFLLPAGVYYVWAEPLDSRFWGRFAVGPYAGNATDISFQPPMYNQGVPAGQVTASRQLSIAPGCSAVLTFRNNGGTSEYNSCGGASNMLTPELGFQLGGDTVNFSWDAGMGTITDRMLLVGTTPGGSEIYSGSQGASRTSRVVLGVPTDGNLIYVRLASLVDGAWQSRDYSYTAAELHVVPAQVTGPDAWVALPGATVTFRVSAGAGVTSRTLSVGSTIGGSQYYGPTNLGSATSVQVSNLPTNGSTVYVRLSQILNGSPLTSDYQYTAASLSPSLMSSPSNGSTLAGASQLLQWTAGAGVAERYLTVGSTSGGSDIYAGYQGSALSRTVTGIPVDGRPIYVRLSSWLGGNWSIANYTYTAFGSGWTPPAAPAASNITSPANGSTLAGASVTFQWDAGASVAERYFMVSSTVGGSDIYAGYQGAALSKTVSTLPTDGRTVYVRLMSYVSGAWIMVDRTYTASGTGGGPPATPTASNITSPANGSTLAGSTDTFAWDAGASVAERYLMVGSGVGASDIYAGYQGAALSKTVTPLPTDGRTVYVRLMSYVNGSWISVDRTYTASGTATPTPCLNPGTSMCSPSLITSPTSGTTLNGTSVTFSWTAGTNVADRYLSVGTTVGGSQIYGGYQGAAVSKLVTGLPTGSVTVYVRLMSYVSGAWEVTDYWYTSAP